MQKPQLPLLVMFIVKRSSISFPLADRKLLNATFIGAYSNRMLTWDAQSPLSKLTEEASVQSNLAKALHMVNTK